VPRSARLRANIRLPLVWAAHVVATVSAVEVTVLTARTPRAFPIVQDERALPEPPEGPERPGLSGLGANRSSASSSWTSRTWSGTVPACGRPPSRALLASTSARVVASPAAAPRPISALPYLPTPGVTGSSSFFVTYGATRLPSPIDRLASVSAVW
jgi:hypothetical protein